MGGNWEIVVVVIIVAAAATWALRGVWRATRKKQICSSCASSGGCPLADSKTEDARSSECLPTIPVLDRQEDRS